MAEREVSALLQTWWRRAEPDCLFVRSPSSGGWQTPKAREGFQAGSDIMTTALRFPFGVEVKRREGWCWKNVTAGMPSPVWAWWRQSQMAAAEMHKQPMLWFRKNREQWRVMVPESNVLARAGFMTVARAVATGDQLDLKESVVQTWNPVDLLRVNVGIHPIVLDAALMLACDPACFL